MSGIKVFIESVGKPYHYLYTQTLLDDDDFEYEVDLLVQQFIELHPAVSKITVETIDILH